MHTRPLRWNAGLVIALALLNVSRAAHAQTAVAEGAAGRIAGESHRVRIRLARRAPGVAVELRTRSATHACREPVTFDRACTLEGVAPGEATITLGGRSSTRYYVTLPDADASILLGHVSAFEIGFGVGTIALGATIFGLGLTGMLTLPAREGEHPTPGIGELVRLSVLGVLLGTLLVVGGSCALADRAVGRVLVERDAPGGRRASREDLARRAAWRAQPAVRLLGVAPQVGPDGVALTTALSF